MRNCRIWKKKRLLLKTKKAHEKRQYSQKDFAGIEQGRLSSPCLHQILCRPAVIHLESRGQWTFNAKYTGKLPGGRGRRQSRKGEHETGDALFPQRMAVCLNVLTYSTQHAEVEMPDQLTSNIFIQPLHSISPSYFSLCLAISSAAMKQCSKDSPEFPASTRKNHCCLITT